MQGQRRREGSDPVQCTTCGGVGQVRMQQGFFSIQQTCPTCKGAGTTIKDPCTACNGRGRNSKTKTLNVKVPAGVDDGDRIRLSGEGEAGRNGGPPGDLYVEIRVEPHKIFDREGSRPVLRGPGQFRDGHPWRRCRSADARRHRIAQNSVRNAIWQDLQTARQRCDDRPRPSHR